MLVTSADLSRQPAKARRDRVAAEQSSFASASSAVFCEAQTSTGCKQAFRYPVFNCHHPFFTLRFLAALCLTSHLLFVCGGK
jgi:hypothetical protein